MENNKDILCKRIMDYLKGNPDAGDTLEGIAGWWLNGEALVFSIDDVGKAIDILVHKGLIKAVQVSPGTTIYKLKTASCRKT